MWGGFGVLILLSLIVFLTLGQLRNFGPEASEVARDVGPSAGYIACLGLVSTRLKRPWSWVSGGVLLVVFLVAFLSPAGARENPQVKFSADLAHLRAFPLGWFSSSTITARRLRLK